MRVIEFHPETQTVDLIQDTYEFTNSPVSDVVMTNELGVNVAVTLAPQTVLFDVPVKQERWGQFQIQACPVEGDTGYIEVFTDDIRDWVLNGSDSIPWSDNKFVKGNCVFVPFIPNHTNAAEDYPVDNYSFVIKSNNASIKITDKPAEQGEDPIVDITATANTMNVFGDVTLNGDLNITGNMTVNGEITATETISAEKDITSKTDVIGGGVSLKTHTHNFTVTTTGTAATQTGSGITEAPTGQGSK